MEKRLALFAATVHIARFAGTLYLPYVPNHTFPALYLTLIVGASASREVSAIPLEPAAGVLIVNPTLIAPHGKRLGGVDAEIVQLRVVAFMTEFRVLEPLFGEFVPAVGHVFPAEDSHFQHLLGRKLRFEIRMEIFAYRFGAIINIIRLHQIVYDYF